MEKDEKCKCLCPDGPCEHVWDGPVEQLTSIDKNGEPYMSGETATCSKCRMTAIHHSLLVGP